MDGLSANARVEAGEKIDALQPFPAELTSIRYPLYSIVVIFFDVGFGARYRPNFTLLLGTFDPYYFNCHELRDVVQRPGGELPNELLDARAAYNDALRNRDFQRNSEHVVLVTRGEISSDSDFVINF